MTEKENDIFETEEPKQGYMTSDEIDADETEEQIDNHNYKSANKLNDKVAIITGTGDRRDEEDLLLPAGRRELGPRRGLGDQGR